MIDFSKPVKTRKGEDVRILCTDRKTKHDDDIIGLILKNNDEEIVCFWNKNGKYTQNYDHDFDLVNVPETRWINIYKSSESQVYGNVHLTKEAADKNASCERIACIEVKWQSKV